MSHDYMQYPSPSRMQEKHFYLSCFTRPVKNYSLISHLFLNIKNKVANNNIIIVTIEIWFFFSLMTWIVLTSQTNFFSPKGMRQISGFYCMLITVSKEEFPKLTVKFSWQPPWIKSKNEDTLTTYKVMKAQSKCTQSMCQTWKVQGNWAAKQFNFIIYWLLRGLLAKVIQICSTLI